ncbi:MAG: transaldolase [Sumerlaeia bacterium]
MTTVRRIALGTDHGGYEIKQRLVEALAAMGLQPIDCGSHTPDSCDYPVFAKRVAAAVSGGAADMGVLLCKSGNGMAITANRFDNVRAGLAATPHEAALTRQHNASNVLVLGGEELTSDPVEIVKAFLDAEPESGRHARRVGMIRELDTLSRSKAGTHKLRRAEVQPWLDDLGAELIESGRLQALVEDGHILGLTSNPSIFQKSIAGGKASYPQALEALRQKGATRTEAYDDLIGHDIRRACDILRPLYDLSEADEGFVSLEVPPALAHDADATVAEAQRLRALIDRPNLMIKVPGTEAGLRAFRRLIADGAHVNVTLLFSEAQYRAVARAYMDGLRDRATGGHPVHHVRSVASVFVSRVDVLANGLIAEKANSASDAAYKEHLCAAHNQVGLANARRVDRAFRELFFEGPAFADMASLGAAPQRLLWASTGVKDDSLSPTFYVENLTGHFTVNTMPMDTLEAAIASHDITPGLISAAGQAAEGLLAIPPDRGGLALEAMGQQLQDEGLKKFADAFDGLMATLDKKLAGAVH